MKNNREKKERERERDLSNFLVFDKMSKVTNYRKRGSIYRQSNCQILQHSKQGKNNRMPCQQ